MDSMAPLELLPPEIRRYLLAMLEFEGLKNLIHASPIYHRQYLLDRNWFLSKCLDKALCGATIEAGLVYRSGSVSFADARTRDVVYEVLKSYQERRKLPKNSILDGKLTLDDLACIAAFHYSVVVPMVSRYTIWALENLSKQPESLLTYPLDSLSDSEEIRITRALYRFQMWCNLFGIGPHGKVWSPRSAFSSIDILKALAGCFEPWEVEEIVCIFRFSEAHFQQTFDQISWDVNQENPKFDGQRPPTPDGAFDLISFGDSFLIGTISQGLELLYKVAFRVQDHSELVSIMQSKLTLHSWFLGEGVLGSGAQIARRGEAPSDQDLKEQQRVPLPFRGDQFQEPYGEYPPFAWTFMWKETYSNITGHWLTETMGENGPQHWGYVFWDERRLRSSDAIDVLIGQIAADWGEEDLRDHVY
ncbi:uncharacterized protein N7506_006832 [Penicillium brevicompactum]|uniref:uncharacterized protein n=1 Tax=Penicillium brevicompactum TaxID=5074 RepID=UPI00253FB1A2|nr:uncharacterized protein N7506_006832 [Penicillium brevicompactum]KAJ5333049.1 hypothetical protein N7506_006832 [Penicillium brevicompactum]